MEVLPNLQVFLFLVFHSTPFRHRLTYTASPPHSGNQTAQTSSHKADSPSPLNSDLAKCISEIGIVAIIRNYPNSLLKYWRLVIIYKCRITFSYNFSSHSASLPLLSQTSNTSSDKLLPLHPVFGHPKVNQKLSPRHRMKSVQVDRQ